MATAGERHEQLMQQMAALTANLGGLTNLNPLLAQQQKLVLRFFVISGNGPR